MPKIYLSPSTQDWNMYVTGSGSEEYNMNLLADALVPYLLSNGIQYRRNRPEMTAGSSVREANQGEYDLYLALHSNAAPEGKYGQVRGIIVFYYPTSQPGQRASTIIANNLKAIYPLPSLVRAQGTTTIGEVRRVRAPSAFLELGYHDNLEDANWIKENLDAVARNLVMSLTDFFDIPFLTPEPIRSGRVDVDWGVLNIRARPNLNASILAQAPDGAPLAILNHSGGWYLVNYKGTIGYAKDDFVTLNG